jgi:hypothetical protein
VAEIAAALDGRYRPEHLLELRCSLEMWEKYLEMIAVVDQAIAAQLRLMQRQTELPPLPPQPRARGRKPHDPRFDVRTALYFASGVDLTAIEGIDELNALTDCRKTIFELHRSVGLRQGIRSTSK